MAIPIIIAGVLIAKGLTLLGPEGEITEEKLEGYLGSLSAANADGLVKRLQDEVDTAVHLLVAAHTAVVMMQASTREFKPNPALDDKETIMVAAFDPDEVGRNAQPGKIQQSKHVIASVLANTGGGFLGTRLLQEVNGVPVLQQYMEKLVDLPPDFEVESCLETCRETTEHAGVRDLYFLPALAMVRSVLGEGDLDQARAWLNDAPNPSEKTLDWLKGKLDNDTLDKQVTTCYGVDRQELHDKNEIEKIMALDETQMALSRIAAMLDENAGFYNRIYERVELLEEAIKDDFPGDLAIEQKEALTNLVWAMCGAIAWRIFRQTWFAAWEARTALGRVPWALGP